MNKLAALLLAILGCDRAPSAPAAPSEWTVEALDLGGDAVIDGLAGTSSKDVWLLAAVGPDRVVRHFDGHTWQAIEPPVRGARAIWAAAANDVWAVGRAGTVAHWDGVGWTAMQIPDVPLDLVDVVGFGDRVVAAAAGPRVFAYDGHTWSTLEPPEFAGAAVFKLWGTSASNVMMPLNRMDRPITLAHYSGRWWSFEEIGPGAGVKMAGTSPSDVWLLSPQTTYHFDGKAWTAIPVPRQKLFAVAAGTPTRAVAVGEDGAALIWDGARWRDSPTGTTERLRAAYVAPDGQAWISGARLYRRALP
jgi:hypothetical protein